MAFATKGHVVEVLQKSGHVLIGTVGGNGKRLPAVVRNLCSDKGHCEPEEKSETHVEKLGNVEKYLW